MISLLCRSWMYRVGFLGLAFLAALGTTGRAQASSVTFDGFEPDINGVVNIIVRQNDGKLIIGGQFTQVRTYTAAPVDRNNLARFNRDGTVDLSFNPNVNDAVTTLLLQPDGKIVVGGRFTSVQPAGAAAATTCNRVVRLQADGSVDATFDPTVGGNAVLTVNALALQANGQILLGALALPVMPGDTAPHRRLVRLNTDGSVDASFDPNPNSVVNAIAVQNDGKILVGGGFTTVQPNGAATATVRNRIARFNADGSLDTSFDPNANNAVNAIVVQPNGAILVGGTFTQFTPALTGVVSSRPHLGRLTPAGDVDSSYNPSPNGNVNTITLESDGRALIGGTFSGLVPNNLSAVVTRNFVARVNYDGSVDINFDPSANYVVNTIVVESDGRIVLGGNFTQLRVGSLYAAVPVNRVARVANDGSADVPFSSDLAGRILTTAQQADGKLVIGGTFVSIGGFTHFRLARLNIDGSVDGTFNPTFNGTVQALSVQSDGKILVGGTFTATNGTNAAYFVRLNVDGTLDTTFAPNPTGSVNSIALQSDGKVLFGGLFTTIQPKGDTESTLRYYLARLNADGSVDKNFDPEPNGAVLTIAVQSDGKIMIGGAFTTVQPNVKTVYARYYLARLNADGTVDGNYIVHATSQVNALVVQSDGKVVIGGAFTQIQPLGQTLVERHHLARITTDGKVDPDFDPNVSDPVLTLALQGSKILVGGTFTLFQPNGAAAPTARNFFARLNADGSLDTTLNLNPSYRPYDAVTSVLVQADQKIVITGDFVSVGVGGATTPQTHLVRLNADGSLDQTFLLGRADRTQVQINALAIGLTDRIVAGGSFSNLNGSLSPNLARFNYDGTPDLAFNPAPNGPVNALAIVAGATAPTGAVSWLQSDGTPLADAAAKSLLSGAVSSSARLPDGTIVLGGSFSRGDGSPGTNVAKVTSTGGLSATFTPTVSGPVYAVAVQSDGRILIAGNFATVNSNAHANLARLNADGSIDTSFNPSTNGAVLTLAVQSDGKILIGGAFTTVQGTGAATATDRGYLARLNADGTLDTAYNVIFNNAVTAVALQSDGKALVGGSYGTVQPVGVNTPVDRLHLIRLKTDGTIDSDFNPAPNAEVYAITVQPDGLILIGGAFTTIYADTSAPVSRAHFARLGTDGRIDPTLGTVFNSNVQAIALTSDGNILVGGAFTTVLPNDATVAVARARIARLKPTGALDTTFTPSYNGSVNALTIAADGNYVVGGGFSAIEAEESVLAGGAFTALNNVAAIRLALVNADGSIDPSFAPNPDGEVQALLRQPDGSLLVGGQFSAIGGGTRSYVARLSAAGALDGSFDAAVNGPVTAFAPQADGQLLLGGIFTTVHGTLRSYLARVSATGALDASFNPLPNSHVDAIAIQADGKILVGGGFTQIAGGARNYIARLNADGTLDGTFTADPNGIIQSIAVQADGHILVSGTSVTEISGAAVPYFARLNADGSFDTTFSTSGAGQVTAFVPESDGRVVIGGNFETVDGQPRFNIARIFLGGTAAQHLELSADIGTVTWVRSGASPELAGVEFETAPDGQSWTPLGTATRVGTTSNWQLSGLSLANGADVFIRARGVTLTGPNTSSGLLQSAQEFYTAGVPAISSPTTVNAATGTAFFYGIKASNSPTTYAATGLPAGLTIDPATGLISGQATQTGTFTVNLTATNANGTASATLTLIVSTPAASTAARLVNLSARVGLTGSGAPAISGFVITGSTARSVLVRAAGPALAHYGVQQPASAPRFTVHTASGAVVLSAAAWDSSNGLSTVFAQLGAFPFDTGSADAATVVTLNPGAYTVHTSTGLGSDGIALAEIYDSAAIAGDTTRLVNLSTRATISSGEGVVIGGFVIHGTGTRRMLVRVAGPALTGLGVADAVTDPVLSLYNASNVEIARNDNWETPVTVAGAYPAVSASEISGSAATAGAFAFASGSKDAAIIVTLPEGTYTAQAMGVLGATGEALIEVYELPDLAP
ncbi:putative Ig domain-containing protein [Horticoccus luteus]|uniref:Ig domain-containing protein n=1 Tax=Horticoccus luteus TaxID=2862869 RepID=A0A8F9TWL7_9BACT|nr:putative Ig domain-containing protein [Horticoccus luteus]QYM79159.1 putative Ig domain-containing protein [Horticoccus luteus]